MTWEKNGKLELQEELLTIELEYEHTPQNFPISAFLVELAQNLSLLETEKNEKLKME